MSIFGSIQMAGNTLQAMQIGLHVVGNNIANANTPGFVRETAIFKPAPVQKIGNLTLGLGVEVAGIVQNVDKFVEARLRDAGGDRASADVQNNVYRDLEAILGELTDTDVSTSLSNFFNSVDEVLKQPEEISIRNLAVQSGRTLTTAINALDRRVETVHLDFSQQIENLAIEINNLAEEVRQLNLQIVALEGGGHSGSEAGGLRSQRNQAVKRLAEIAGVQVTESEVGSVNVTVGGEFLVFEGTRREVEAAVVSKDDRRQTTVQFVDNGAVLEVGSGELHGAYAARDEIVGGFLDRIDQFAASLAFEFNKVYSQGQGISGYSEVASRVGVNDPDAALDEAGLAFSPVHGEFELLVYNDATGLPKTTRIQVDLSGVDGDDSLAALAAKIDAVEFVVAEITNDNRLSIRTESPDSQIAFASDTSGLLAALGINTFFTGSHAGDLGVNVELLADGSKFAAARDGLGVGVENAQRLVSLHDASLDSLSGGSIYSLYDALINETTQGAT
ncbi:MAG: flagellar hook-associated protein FlgK, partial [Planctomycetota bacterium]